MLFGWHVRFEMEEQICAHRYANMFIYEYRYI